MGMSNILVWSCAHADPQHSNERFDWLGQYIYDTKPDVCIDLGDGADMRSLNSYDTRYPQSVVHQSYEADIDVYNDSQERLRAPFKRNHKKRPEWIGLEGNHEFRIKKAVMENPRIEGQKYGVSFGHLQTEKWFDQYYEYENDAPAIAQICGVDFAHYFGAGNFGRAISGKHHAFTLINERHNSSVCGHSHKFAYYPNHGANSIGLVVGCYKGGEETWAGQANKGWWKGVVLLKNVENGVFDIEQVSLAELERVYG
jgi:hypothetical protein